MSTGYSKTPLWKKLGLREGNSLLLLDAPAGWELPQLPTGISSHRAAGTDQQVAADVILTFFMSLAALRERISVLARMIFPDGAVWIAWPRRAGGHESDITDNEIRALALPLGLVDVKVAAIDEDWSGLRLVWRVERRSASSATQG
ncbi:MAG: DUF3052 domain-containing protein [Solirubrobacteraceae bacterium]